MELFNDTGFDDFVNALEPSPFSKNQPYFGKLHNTGHVSAVHFFLEELSSIEILQLMYSILYASAGFDFQSS